MIYEEVTRSNHDVEIILVMIYAKNEYQQEDKIKNEIARRLDSPEYPSA